MSIELQGNNVQGLCRGLSQLCRIALSSSALSKQCQPDGSQARRLLACGPVHTLVSMWSPLLTKKCGCCLAYFLSSEPQISLQEGQQPLCGVSKRFTVGDFRKTFLVHSGGCSYIFWQCLSPVQCSQHISRVTHHSCVVKQIPLSVFVVLTLVHQVLGPHHVSCTFVQIFSAL